VCVQFGNSTGSIDDVQDIVGPKPTYGRDGDASPRTLGFSKIVSLLVSLNEPKCKVNKHMMRRGDRTFTIACQVLFRRNMGTCGIRLACPLLFLSHPPLSQLSHEKRTCLTCRSIDGIDEFSAKPVLENVGIFALILVKVFADHCRPKTQRTKTEQRR